MRQWLSVLVVGFGSAAGCFPAPHVADVAESADEVATEIEAEVAVEIEPGECASPADCGRLAGPCRRLLCIHGTCATEPDEGAACDDANACTQGDTCTGYVCGGTAYACDDGVPCTDDVCDGQGGCDYPAKTGFCHIADACIASGTVKADDPCRVCAGGDAWTPNDGASCDDGDACTVSDQCQGTGCVAGHPPDDSAGDWATVVATGEIDSNSLPIAVRPDGGLHVAASVRNGELLGAAVTNEWRAFELALDAAGHLPPSATWMNNVVVGTRLGLSAVSGSLDALWSFTFDTNATLHWSHGDLALNADVAGSANAVIARTSGDAASPPMPFRWFATSGSGGQPAVISFGIAGAGTTTCATFWFRNAGISGPAFDPALPSTDALLGVTASLESDGPARWAVASVLAGVPVARRENPGCILVGGALRAGNVPTVGEDLAVSPDPGIVAYWWNDDAKVESFAPIIVPDVGATTWIKEFRATGDDGLVGVFGVNGVGATLGANAAHVDNAGIHEFVAAFAKDGLLRWVHRLEVGDQGYVSALAVTDDAVWIGGAIDTSATLPSDSPETSITLNTTAPGADGFVARYDLAGALVWAELVARGPGAQGVRTLVASPIGGVLAAGIMEGDTDIGTLLASRSFRATGKALFAMRFDSARERSCLSRAP